MIVSLQSLIFLNAKHLTWTYKIFEYDLVRYWYSAEKHVREWRRVDPETWLTLERLVNKLVALDRKRGQPLPTKEELTRFLKEEAQLL